MWQNTGHYWSDGCSSMLLPAYSIAVLVSACGSTASKASARIPPRPYSRIDASDIDTTRYVSSLYRDRAHLDVVKWFVVLVHFGIFYIVNDVQAAIRLAEDTITPIYISTSLRL
jgi:hypothetical protein